MTVNWNAILWRGLSSEARDAARKLDSEALKLPAILLAARYIAMAVRAERKEPTREAK